MLHLAWRNLLQNRARLAVSLGGVGLALTLILSFDAIVEGAQQRLTAYIDESGADLFVSQQGVRNMHMASSTLPASVVDEVRRVPGVEAATPILYVTSMVAAGDGRYLAYVIGLPTDATMGRPWQIVSGSPIPGPGEAIIDRTVADQAGVSVGDRVTVLGEELTVAGLADGTANIVNSIAFISFEDFARLRGGSPVVSYVLVKVAPGESPDAVSRRIEASVGGVTALTRDAFAREERQLVRDMMTDVISIMNLVGFSIGLSVVALTVYIATFARRAEFGVLKAVGAGNGHLYRVVIAQALLSVALGLAIGLAFTLTLTAVVPRAAPELTLAVSGSSVAKVAAVSLLIAGLSAILPIRQIAGLDPAIVFRGGVTR